MSETAAITRDKSSGRFLAGNSGNGGRKPGARNKLSERFIADVEASWRQHGPSILDRVAREDPSTYLRAIVALQPRDVSIDISLDVQITEALENLRAVNGGKRSLAAERIVGRLLKSDVIDAEPGAE